MNPPEDEPSRGWAVDEDRAEVDEPGHSGLGVDAEADPPLQPEPPVVAAAQPPRRCADRRRCRHGGARPVQHRAGESRRRRLRPRSGRVGERVGDTGQGLDGLLAADPEALTANRGGEPGAGHTGPHHSDGGEEDDQSHPLAERQVIHLATRWRRRALRIAHPRLQAESLARGRQHSPTRRAEQSTGPRIVGSGDSIRDRMPLPGASAPIGYRIGCRTADRMRHMGGSGATRGTRSDASDRKIAIRIDASDVAYDVASDPRSSPSSA